MNIAFVAEMYHHNPNAGIAVWTKRLSDYCNEKGFQSRIYSYTNGFSSNIPNFIKLVPNVRELLVYPYLGMKNLSQIESGHDLIHYASPLTAAWHKGEIPCVMTTHYIISRQSYLLGKYLPKKYKLFFNPLSYNSIKFIEKQGFQRASIITACRQSLKDYLIEHMQIPEERIEIIKYGIDNTKFKPGTPGQKKENIALFVGRGSLPKGFDTFIEAAKMIKGKAVAVATQVPKDILRIADKLKNVEIKSGLSEQELIETYQSATVFVMPSLSEGAPLTTLEAMASGLPVVCTTEGGGDYIEDGYSGFIFDFKNAEQLSEKVNYLFDHPDKATEFGKRNRQKVDTEFTLKTVADKFVEIYKKLV